MSTSACGSIRELLPDMAASRLSVDLVPAVEEHVAGCEECRAELELLQLLTSSAPAAPAGLEARLHRAVHPRRGSGVQRPWWGLTAAAVAALAVGIGVSSETEPGADAAPPAYAMEVEQGDVWSSEDGLLAGAPALDGLSDEALLELLDELDAGRPGGAV